MSQPTPSLRLEYWTIVFGSTFSKLVRAILPVVKAWPRITVGCSQVTTFTRYFSRSRRSSTPQSVKCPGVAVAFLRTQNRSSPPIYNVRSAGSLSRYFSR